MQKTSQNNTIFFYEPCKESLLGLPQELQHSKSASGKSIEMLYDDIKKEYLHSNYEINETLLVLFFDALLLSKRKHDVLGKIFSPRIFVKQIKPRITPEFKEKIKKENLEKELNKSLRDEDVEIINNASELLPLIYLLTTRKVLQMFLNSTLPSAFERAQDDLWNRIQNRIKEIFKTSDLLMVFVGMIHSEFIDYYKGILSLCGYKPCEFRKENLDVVELMWEKVVKDIASIKVD